MALIDRALRVGEGKKFKAFEKNVARINDYEPEFELYSDEELREDGRQAARARPQRRAARRPAVRELRPDARGGPAHDGDAPLRRPADRRHGPARRLDRRDEDRRGQDAHRHARRRAEHARRRRRPPRHRQRLPGSPRRRVDEADLRRARRQRRDSPVGRAQSRPRSATTTPPTSPTGRTPSSASTTCATTSRSSSRTRSSAATRSRSWTRSTTSSSTRRARR